MSSLDGNETISEPHPPETHSSRPEPEYITAPLTESIPARFKYSLESITSAGGPAQCMTLLLTRRDEDEAPARAGSLKVHRDAKGPLLSLEDRLKAQVSAEHKGVVTQLWSQIDDGRSGGVDLTSESPEVVLASNPKSSKDQVQAWFVYSTRVDVVSE